MKQVIDIVEKEDRSYGFDSSALVESGIEETAPSKIDNKKRGPGRPRTQDRGLYPSNTYTDIVTDDKESLKRKKNSYESQVEKSYYPQAQLIAGVLTQAENLYNDINEQLNFYKTNKSAGGKTRALTIAELQNTQVSIINTKLAAIREINNVRHKINDLSIKHEQMMKGMGEENSDKAITDSYYALINAPRYGLPTFTQPLHPASINTGVNLQGGVIPSAPIVTAVANESPTPPPINTNLNPVQQRMIMEKNPNIKTVVVYNQSTGDKYFDVVDVSKGVSIPNVERPAKFLLDDMVPDFRNGVATNSNANMSFPLVLQGTRAMDEL